MKVPATVTTAMAIGSRVACPCVAYVSPMGRPQVDPECGELSIENIIPEFQILPYIRQLCLERKALATHDHVLSEEGPLLEFWNGREILSCYELRWPELTSPTRG